MRIGRGNIEVSGSLPAYYEGEIGPDKSAKGRIAVINNRPARSVDSVIETFAPVKI